MRVSHDRRLILVENPGCGNASFAAYVKAEPIPGVPENAPPTKANRAKVKEWLGEGYSRAVLVRDPVSRFITAVLAAREFSTEDAYEIERRGGEEYLAIVRETKAAENLNAACAAVLAFLSRSASLAHAGLPLAFVPQVEWLRWKMELVLCTEHLAEYANCAQRGTMPHSAARTVTRNLPDALALAIRQFYGMDYAKFATLPVWSPKAHRPRLVTGPCVECEKRLAAAARNAEDAAITTVAPSPILS